MCVATLCRARERTMFVASFLSLSLSLSLSPSLSFSPSLSCLWCRAQRKKRERERERLHHKTEDVLHTNGDIEKKPHCASASNISVYFVTRVSLGLTFADHYIRFSTILIFCYRLLRLHDLAA